MSWVITGSPQQYERATYPDALESRLLTNLVIFEEGEYRAWMYPVVGMGKAGGVKAMSKMTRRK
ncbi:hypothetical protein HYALB_00013009 [Hymenoscyphus albidus]|uniref:Uncharacterized protein n=1 Tax=Hymenoscyphus albidus TaxID=595503 RepID=A0A9N9LLJ0_9HELO|nr:hypothetical protein HYALB_00013009 [Hymenoscyphus albidus]